MLVSLAATLTSAGQERVAPAPHVYDGGPALRFDFPEMQVGVAEYEEGPTGTTVFYFPKGVKGAVDVRGGAPGTLNADTLRNGYERPMVRAVVFSGGSWFGLSAATGVANAIKAMKIEEGDVDSVPDVVAAIIYDIGGRRFSRVTPDDALGQAALRSAKTGSFPLGARGAGRFAMQGGFFPNRASADGAAEWPHSGQGGAFTVIGPTKIAVFTVVNALGAIVDREGRVVRCRRNASSAQCPTIAEHLKSFTQTLREATKEGPTSNTTLTLVVTNQKLPWAALQRLAVQVHGSMNRAIQPFATEDDGDVLYAVTTDEVENPALKPMDIAVIASELAWDAVLSSVPELPQTPAVLASQPASDGLRKYAGVYEFFGGSELTVAIDEQGLTATINGKGRMYFDQKRLYRLRAATGGDFIVDAPASDVIRFVESGGKVTGLTINPGPWAVSAKAKR
jgi:L-aminopeptidase/D-esterase-like protein